MGKFLRFFFSTFLLWAVLNTAVAQIPADYWAGTEGLTGDSLKNKLSEIINTGVTFVSYTPGVWDAYAHTDVYPKPADTIVWDIYGDTVFYKYVLDTDQCGTYVQEGDCYNREHSFPKSWFGGSTAPGPGTDLHHVFASDGFVNNQRSSYPYGEVDAANATFISLAGNMLGPSALPDTNLTMFEPVDKYKGDLARALFYMAVMYKDSIPGWVQTYGPTTDIDVVFLPDGSFRPWYYEMLYEWHQLDPVSQKELDRNDSIYNIQGNANPFIEHPEWVCKVFGSSCVAPPDNFSAQAYGSDQILLTWSPNASNDSVLLAYNVVPVFGTPDTVYSPGDTINGGGVVLYTGKDTSFIHTVQQFAIYYYQIWAFNDSMGYSVPQTAYSTPLKPEPGAYPPNFTATALSATSIQVTWTDEDSLKAPDGFVVEISIDSTFITPVDGQPLANDLDVSDGFGLVNVPHGVAQAVFTNLQITTKYYFVIYPYTNSDTNINYLTDGTPPTASATTLSQCATDLIISEYGEGSSYNKYLEIYNGTGEQVDLSQYRIGLIYNGGDWTESSIAFPDGAVIPDGSTYVIVNSSADAALLAKADYTTGALSFNGDDAVALQKLVNGVWVNIDQIGEAGADPGTAWDVAGVVNATADHTLIRKIWVNKPTTDWPAAAGTDADNSQWIVEASDFWDSVGTHQIVCLACEPKIPASNVTFDSRGTDWLNLYWLPGDGENYLVLMKAGSPVTAVPVDGQTYAANAQFGQGYMFDDGSYAVYNGSGATVAVSGLQPGTVYYIAVFDYSCSLPNYLTDTFATGTANTQYGPVSVSTECAGNTKALISWQPPSGDYDYFIVYGAKDAVPPVPLCQPLPVPDSSFANAPVYCANTVDARLLYVGSNTGLTITDLDLNGTYNFAVSVVWNGTISDGGVTQVTTGVEGVSDLAVTCNGDNAQLTWTLPSCYDTVMVVANTGPVQAVPQGSYFVNSADVTDSQNDTLDDGSVVVYYDTGDNVTVTGLNCQAYYFGVYVKTLGEWSAADTIHCDSCSNVAGVSDLQDLTVYPNPADDYLVVSIDRQDFTVEVYTQTGRKVLEKNVTGNTARLNVSGLAPGVYILRISTRERTLHYRVVKR